MAVVITVAVAAVALCCIAAVIISRRYVLRAYNDIDAVLDRLLAKDTRLRDEKTGGEDRISKLVHKTSRLMDMYADQAAQNMEEKEVIQGFISDMSHQMKTPLSGISMYADLLIEGRLSPEEQREFTNRIKSCANHLQWMISCLIKMSRLEVGAIQLSPTCQHIKPTLSDAIGAVLATASQKNIEITVEDFTDTPLLHDKRWTQEAIVNILENAVKYSHLYGTVNIAVTPLPLYTKITITDYGMGIQKNDWHLIFKRFYRGSNAKETEGAGLGLYLATLIMEKQGGDIMVDSIVGEHTSFTLFLQNCKK